MVQVSGGDKFDAFLKEMERRLKSGGGLEVGFMEGSQEKNGLPIPLVAYWNEYGDTYTIPAHDVTVYRSVNKKGAFNKKGRFVKKAKANFITTHRVEAVTVTRPPRPFFRTMIAENNDHWGKDFVKILKKKKFNVDHSLEVLGLQLEGELLKSVKSNAFAPLAKSTIRKKGNDQQLIDSGLMAKAIHSVVIP